MALPSQAIPDEPVTAAEEPVDVDRWREKWSDENAEFIDKVDLVTGLIKMLNDARTAGIRRISYPPHLSKFVVLAVKQCEPWAKWESWYPYHFFVNLEV